MAIRVETSAFSDIRFKLLAVKLKIDKWSARARVEDLWEHCTQRETHYLTKEVINTVTECENFADALLDENIGLAKETKHGIYLSGTVGRIEWLSTRRKASQKGGEVTRAIWLAKRRPKAGQRHRPNEGPTPTPTPTPKKQYICADVLEKTYDSYPKRKDGRAMGKKLGMERLTRTLTSPEKLEKFQTAVTNYKNHIEKNNAYQFIMMWSRFAGQWEEWEATNVMPKKPIDYGFETGSEREVT